MIRKWIVRNFALDYFGNLFGWHFNAPRASRIIFPLMILNGLVWDVDNITVFSVTCIVLLTISLFLGFIYFRFYPVKWDELDDNQKLQINSK